VINPTQRPLPDKTQHSKETDIHAPGGIPTRHPSKRAAADPRFRPRGHCAPQQHLILNNIAISLYVLESNTAMFSWRSTPKYCEKILSFHFFHIKSIVYQQNTISEEDEIVRNKCIVEEGFMGCSAA